MARELFNRLLEDKILYTLQPVGELSVDAAIEKLYQAFAGYEVDMPRCDTCFPNPSDLYHRLRGVRSVKDADPVVYSPLFWESPYCGGASSWKRFFPTMLCSGLWNYNDLYLFDRAVGSGMWAWPAQEQVAIREVVTAAFVEWVTNKNEEPLGYRLEFSDYDGANYKKYYSQPDAIGQILIEGLLLCRVDPVSLMEWMLTIDNNKTRALFARLISDEFNFWGWGIDSNDDEGIDNYAAACRQLAGNLVTEEMLINWHLEAEGDLIAQSSFESAAREARSWKMLVSQPTTEQRYELFIASFKNSTQQCELLWPVT